MSAVELFPDADRNRIVSAIAAAELHCSGEIRVHIENYCPKDAAKRAIQVFNKLGMYRTKARNGVLIYVAVVDRKLAIIGDTGINAVVPEGFWQDIIDCLKVDFASSGFTEGLCKAVTAVGEHLCKHFPYKEDDVDEQTNEISFGND